MAGFLEGEASAQALGHLAQSPAADYRYQPFHVVVQFLNSLHGRYQPIVFAGQSCFVFRRVGLIDFTLDVFRTPTQIRDDFREAECPAFHLNQLRFRGDLHAAPSFAARTAAHRALIARRADSLRCFGVRSLAVRRPPLRPSATAAGSFRFFRITRDSIRNGAKKQSSTGREKSY